MQLDVINCVSWSDPIPGGGHCALGLYGGRPHRGACRRCDRREPRPAGSEPPAPASEWEKLYRGVAAAQPSTLARVLDEFQRGLHPDRGRQLAGMRRAEPMPTDSIEAALRWVVDRHQDIRRRIGRGPLDVDAVLSRWRAYAAAFHVHHTGWGLGDAVQGLYAACGLADATGRPVVYHAHSAAWLSRASHPGVTIERVEDGFLGVDLNGGAAGFSRQIHQAEGVVAAYCENLSAALGVGPFGGRRPAMVDRQIRGEIPTGRYVVLAPFSQYVVREWPRAKWQALAYALHDLGLGVRAIGSADQLQALKETFGPTRASWFFGASPDTVADLMIGAAAVVGSESGPVHLAGLLDVPAVSVHPGCLPHGFLYSCAPSVQSVTHPAPLPRSIANPDALCAIPIADVVAGVQRVIGSPSDRRAA